MGRKYQVISGDGHLETPPDRWVQHMPEKYRDRAPRLVKLEDGGEGWLVEGMPLTANGVNLTGGRPIKYSNESYWEADGTPSPGSGTPAQRLTEQDKDGLDAEVLYPPVFASRFIEAISDRRVYLAMIRAYNEFLAEYCSVAPDRLIGNGIIPTSGIEDALAELKRCKELGLLSMSPIQFPSGGGEIKPKEDDRFWELALELDMPISPHVSIGDRSMPSTGKRAVSATANGAPPQANAMAHSVTQGGMWSIVQLISSGTFDRFPDLRFYFAETNAGWLPWSIFAVDEAWRRREHLYPDHGVTMKPSEYIRKHIYFGFVCDPLATKFRDHLPAEHLLWGSDFPHSAGSYPDSKDWIARMFSDVPADLRRKLLLENAVSFFHLDIDADITPTPAMATAGAAPS
jgi:predicted TIM-barrel fold metal-dependent hydrolase